MNYRKVMLVALVLLAILTIGAVSASDNADDLTAIDNSGGDDAIVAEAAFDDEILSDGNNTEVNEDVPVVNNENITEVNEDLPVVNNENITEVDENATYDIVIYEDTYDNLNDGETHVVDFIFPEGSEGNIIVTVEGNDWVLNIPIYDLDSEDGIYYLVPDSFDFDDLGYGTFDITVSYEEDYETLASESATLTFAADDDSGGDEYPNWWAYNHIAYSKYDDNEHIVHVDWEEAAVQELRLVLNDNKGNVREYISTIYEDYSSKDWTLGDLGFKGELSELGLYNLSMTIGDDTVFENHVLQVTYADIRECGEPVSIDYPYQVLRIYEGSENVEVYVGDDENPKAPCDIDYPPKTWMLEDMGITSPGTYLIYMKFLDDEDNLIDEFGYALEVLDAFDEFRMVSNNEGIHDFDSQDPAVYIYCPQDSEGTVDVTVNGEYALTVDVAPGDWIGLTLEQLGIEHNGDYSIDLQGYDTGRNINVWHIEDSGEESYVSTWINYGSNDKVYNDTEDEVVCVSVPNDIDGIITVEVNGEEKGNWEIEHYDEDYDSYHGWKLSDLEIFDAGDYAITFKLNGDVIDEKELTVWEFKNDEFRLIDDYENDVFRLYCPEGIEGTLTVSTTRVYDEFSDTVYNETFNIVDYTGWSEWKLSDLGFKSDGIDTRIIFNITSPDDDELFCESKYLSRWIDEEDNPFYVHNEVDITDSGNVVLNIWEFPEDIDDDFIVIISRNGTVISEKTFNREDEEKEGEYWISVEELGIEEFDEYEIMVKFTRDGDEIDETYSGRFTAVPFIVYVNDMEEMTDIFNCIYEIRVNRDAEGSVVVYVNDEPRFEANLDDLRYVDVREGINGRIICLNDLNITETGEYQIRMDVFDGEGNLIRSISEFTSAVNVDISTMEFQSRPYGDNWIADFYFASPVSPDARVEIYINGTLAGETPLFFAEEDGFSPMHSGDVYFNFNENFTNKYGYLNVGDYWAEIILIDGEKNVYLGEGEFSVYPQDIHINIWNDDDSRGTLYNDTDSEILSADIPSCHEGTLYVLVNGEDKVIWAPDFDEYDDSIWAYSEWNLEDLGMTEAGEYQVEIILACSEDSIVLVNETISVSEFNFDTYRAMILYAEKSIKLYVPEGVEGTVTIVTEKETEDGEIDFVCETTHEITEDDYGEWIEWSLYDDLEFEADGAFRVFTLTVYDGDDVDAYYYQISYVAGEDDDDDDEDEFIEDIMFRFNTINDDGDMEFDKILNNADVAHVYIPNTDEFDDVNPILYVTLNGEEYATINVRDLYGGYSSRLKALVFEVPLNMTDFKDKDMLVFQLVAEFEDGESAIIEDEEYACIILEDAGEYFIGHDDYDPERLEFSVFFGNLTTNSTNNPELMGANFRDNFVIITISDALNITDGSITVVDEKGKEVFSKALSECDKEYDYGSVGYQYVIRLSEVNGILPENTNLTVTFDYGKGAFSQKRIRSGDYLYTFVIPEDVYEQFHFEANEDLMMHGSDKAVFIYSDTNRQSIYIGLGGGYFIVYVNGVKVEHLGNVSFNAWLAECGFEDDWEYQEIFYPDEDAFKDYVRSYWGDELELFRLTSWNQGAPEIALTLDDLGITESGTYNIRIVHFPSVPGGLDDHSSIREHANDYAEEMLIPTYTEVFNANITCNLDPDYAAVEILKERIYRNGQPFLFTFQFGDNVLSESNRILVYLNDELAFNCTTLFWEENEEDGEMELVELWYLNDGLFNEEFLNEYGVLDAGEYEAVVYLVKGDAAPVEIGRGNFTVMTQKGNMSIEMGLSSEDDGVHTLLYVDIPEGNWDDYSLSINIADSEEIYPPEDDWFARWYDEYVIFKDDAIYFKDSLDKIIGQGTVAIDLGVLDEGTHIWVVYGNGEETVFNGGDFYQNDFTVGALKQSEITADDVTFDYGETVTANITLVGAEDAFANVVGHDEAKITFENGVITVSGLDAGSYTLNITTVPEEGFTAVSKLINITVNKIDANLTVEVSDVYVGEESTIRVFGNGIVKVKIAGNTYEVNCTGGVGILTVVLDAGSYDVNAKFEGDNNTNAAEVNKTFKVSKLTPAIVITAGEAIEGSNLDVTVEIADATGSVDINGETIDLVNGKASTTIENLAAGELNITAIYSGDAKYTNATETRKITVKAKQTPELTVTVADITVGQTATVNVEINANITGKVTVNGNEITITNGKGAYYMTGLNAGEYTATVAFAGDKYYNAVSANKTFAVSKAASSVDANDLTVTYGDVIVIPVTSANATSVKYEVLKDNEIVAQGTVTGESITGLDLAAGSYTVNLTTVVDANHNEAAKAVTLTVSKAQSSLTVPAISFTYGKTGTTTASYTGATGIIAVVNDLNAVVDVDGNVITVSNLAAGSYILTVTTVPDANHEEVTKTADITVSKAASTVDANDVAVTYGDVIVIPVTSTNATAVKYEVLKNNEVVAQGTVTGESITGLNLGAGSYTVNLTTIVDANHNAATKAVTLTVSKAASAVKINVGSAFSVGDSFTIGINATSDAAVTINGQSYSVKNSIVDIDTTRLAAGTYNVVASIAESENYIGSSDSASFTISKVETPAGENPFNFDENKTVESKTPTYTISLPKDATGTLTVTINGKNYTADVVNGSATVVAGDVSAGSYDVIITYSGDDKYSPIVKTSKTTVKVDPRIVAKDLTVEFSAGKYYSVTVYGTDNKVAANTWVTFTLNDKQIAKVKTDEKGVAKFKVEQNPVTKGKLVVKALGVSVAKKLTIKHIVKLYTASISRSAKKAILKVLVKKNGKALKNKKITFKIGNKKYSKTYKNIKTDKKGYAKVTVSSAVLKQFTAKTKVTYSATYTINAKKGIKDTVSKTATVQK